MERLRAVDLAEWKEEKGTAPARDPRSLPLEKETSGARFGDLRSCLADMVPFAPNLPSEWRFEDPDTLLDLPRQARGPGEEIFCLRNGIRGCLG